MSLKQIHRGAISETGTVASKLGTPGEYRIAADGDIYRLCYFPTTGSFGQAVQYATADGNAGYNVNIASVSGVRCAGVHNAIITASQGTATATGQTHASGIYGWVQVKGVGVVSVKASYAANLHLVPSTDGGVSTAANTGSTGNYRFGQTISSVTVGIQSVSIDLF